MTEKKFTKWLRGKNAGKIAGLIFIPLAAILLVAGAVSLYDARDIEPQKYNPGASVGTYCYIDAQYIAEPHAEKTEDGRTVTDYYFVADEDFNWVVVSVSPKRYEEFTDLINYTYDFEADVAPDTIRFTGNITAMEPELRTLSRDYYAEYIAYEAGDVPSDYMLVPGKSSQMQSGITTLALGGFVLLIDILLSLAGSKRRKQARKTVAALRSSGAVSDVISEIDSPKSILCKVANEPSGGNVLGDKYVIIFTAGKVLTYDQLSSMNISVVRDKMVANLRNLNLVDTSGSSYPVVVDTIPTDSSTDGLIEEAIDHITKRNPNCKLV